MITDEMIRYAKSLELPDLIRRRNIDLIPTNSGSSFKCKCPFHDDQNPSFNLNIKDGIWLWNCFACGIGGTNLDFIMKYEGKDFKEAVQMLSREIDLNPGRMPDISITIEKPECSLEDRIRLLSIAAEHYHQTLLNGAGDKGRKYLEKRGLFDVELIKAFKIGLSDGKTAAVLKEERNYDIFSNCVIFPVIDDKGQVTDIYGRRIATYQEAKNHLYNDGRHIGVFNYINVKDVETIILTEGIIDALSIYKSGFKNVTALYGVGNLSEAHEKLLNSVKVQKVILAFDRDIAGIQGVKRFLSILRDVEVFMADFPPKIKDANELYVKQGPEALKQAIDKAFKPDKEYIEARIKVYKLDQKIKEDDAEILKNKLFIEGKEDAFPAATIKKDAGQAGMTDQSGHSGLSGIIPETESLSDNSEFKIHNSELSSIQPSLSDLILPRFQYNGLDLIFESSPLTYQLRDVAKLKNLTSLRFVVTVRKNDNQDDFLPLTDRIDLYLLRSRAIFGNRIAETFKVQTAVIEKDFAAMISFIESDFKRRKASEKADAKGSYKMSDAEESEAMKFLSSPNLIKNIMDHLTAFGYVGEDNNKLLSYLCATSRKLDKPISILIRSQSSTGKSFLLAIICKLMPSEDVHQWTSLTPKALYYMAPDALKHKFIAIDEKAGTVDAEYPIRSLQSGGVLSQAIPIKNPTNNQMITEVIVKEGPISYADCSTDTKTNPENANRCYEIFLDESAEQTRRVQEQQKKAHILDNWQNEEKFESIKRVHQNAQRLLKPVKVIIPYVEMIDFPSEWIRTRRDHDRFLFLIICIAFLHQYQRERKEMNGKPYIEATQKDYAIAYKLAKTVLFNTFQELEKPVFDFYLKLSEMVEKHAKEQNVTPEEFMFTRRNVRQYTKLPDYLVKRYMRILKDLEYFEVKSNGNGSRDVYRLIVQARKIDYLSGLTTPSQLKSKMEQKEGLKK